MKCKRAGGGISCLNFFLKIQIQIVPQTLSPYMDVMGIYVTQGTVKIPSS